MDARDPLAIAYDLIHLRDFIELIEVANKYLESHSKTEDIPTEVAIYIKWQTVFFNQVEKYQALYKEFENLVVEEATKKKVYDFIKDGNAHDLAKFFSMPENAIIFDWYRKVIPDLKQIQSSFEQYKNNTIKLYYANDPNFRIKTRKPPAETPQAEAPQAEAPQAEVPPEAKQETKTQKDSPIFAKPTTASNPQEIKDFIKLVKDTKDYLLKNKFEEDNYEYLRQVLLNSIARYVKEPQKAQEITNEIVQQLNMLVTATSGKYPIISARLTEVRDKFSNITPPPYNPRKPK